MNEPKYDEDNVNLGYLKKFFSENEIEIPNNISKHYGTQPTPPYNIGDTWIEGTIIYTCINSREIGVYREEDWVTESGAKVEAENKNKMYLTQPTHYKIGDMWTLQTDNDHMAGKKGEILITTVTSSTYNATDWVNMLNYASIASINEVLNNLNNAVDRIGVVEEAIEDGLIVTFYQNVLPEGIHIGDLWYVTGEIEGYIKGKIYRYDGGQWLMLTDPAIEEAFTEANEARLVADGKIQSFYSNTQPTEAIGVGDLWINTDDNNKLHRYNGTNWVPVYDTRIENLIETSDRIETQTVNISTDLGDITQTVERHTTDIRETKNEVGEIVAKNEEITSSLGELKLNETSLKLAISKIGGNNLIKNSDMSNNTNFWLKHLTKTYTESNTPPENPETDDYWYCISDYLEYKQAQMYYYDGTNWKESYLTRKQLEQTQNLLSAVSSYEDEYTRKHTISGRMLKFNADDETISSHLFTATNFIDYKENEEYCALGFKIKNSIKTGFIFISMAFYPKSQEELETSSISETIEAMYTKDIVLTPDDLENMTSIELITRIPKKNEFIPVYVGNTPPSDITKRWMDNTVPIACTLKEYNEETQAWIVSDTTMSCYDEVLRNIYFWSNYVGGAYYPSSFNYDENDIKSIVVAITQYRRVSNKY